MADEQQQAQQEAEKKVNVPDSVKVGQALGYDREHFTSQTKRHGDLLKRFGVPTYATFEEKLGTPFSRAVVAFLLGDNEHAQVLGTVLVSDALPSAPGGVKAKDDEASEPDSTYKAGKQEVAVKDGRFFVGGHKFVEKDKADLFARSLDNPAPPAEKNEGFASTGVFEKTAAGADGEVGEADHYKQAQKDKDDSGVTKEVEKQADASTI